MSNKDLQIINRLQKQIVKIAVPTHIWPNDNFKALMESFKLYQKYNHNPEITFKKFREDKNYRLIYFDKDDENLDVYYWKKYGIRLYCKNILDEKKPPLIEVN